MGIIFVGFFQGSIRKSFHTVPHPYMFLQDVQILCIQWISPKGSSFLLPLLAMLRYVLCLLQLSPPMDLLHNTIWYYVLDPIVHASHSFVR